MNDTTPSDRLHCPRCKAIYRVPSPRCPRDGAPLQPLAEDPLVGTRLAQRYDIEALIGEGGMGRVYRARHAELGRTYAIKAMFGDLAANELMRTRFAREADIASQLNHRNVVPVLDFGMPEDSVAYLVMDFLDGVPLSNELATNGPMDPVRVQHIAGGLARGLRYAHGQGLVHRDLKPDNVMLVREDDEEVPKILDFGIAMRADTEKQDRLTSTGNIVGTPTYMAPEQAFGGQIEPSVDLYALGGVLFTCLTGRPPFEGAAANVLHKKLTDPAPPVREMATQPIPDNLASVTDRLLAREPQDRPGSAQDVLDALTAGAIEPVTTIGPVLNEALGELPVPTSRRFIWLLAGGLALMGLGGIVLQMRGTAGDSSDPQAQAVVVAPAPTAGAAPTSDPEPPPLAEPTVDSVIPPPTSPAPRARRTSPRPKSAKARPAPARVEPRPAPAPTPKPKAPAPVQDAPAAKPAPEPPAADSYNITVFTDTYKRVGRGLEAAKDDASITELRRRYLRIPFADGLRVQSVRRDALRELRSIEARLKGPATR